MARAQAHLNMAKGGVHSEEETKAGTNAKQGQAREKSRSRERASSEWGERVGCEQMGRARVFVVFWTQSWGCIQA